jgi:S1-C subfamily serine protease
VKHETEELITMLKRATTLAAVIAATTLAAPGCISTSQVRDSQVETERRAQDSIEDILQSVHCIKVTSKYTPTDPDFAALTPETEGYGTIFAFAKDNEYTYFLTAGHLVRKKDQVLEHPLLGDLKLTSVGYSIIDNALDEKADDDTDLEVFFRDEKMDIAVFRAKKQMHVSTAYGLIDQKDIRVGENAYITGYPRGAMRFVGVGTIGNITGMPNAKPDDEPTPLLVDVESMPGNSGSPMFVRRGDQFYFAGVVVSTFGHITKAIGVKSISGQIPRGGEGYNSPVIPVK